MSDLERAVIKFRDWFSYHVVPNDWVIAGFMDALDDLDREIPERAIIEYRDKQLAERQAMERKGEA